MDTGKLVDDLTARVREALAEAERRAAEAVAEAQARAREIIAEAEGDAQRIRERAEAEAEERLAQVRDALAGLEGVLTRRDAPASEVEPGPVPVPEPTPQPVPEPQPPPVPEPTPPVEPEPMPPEPEIEPPAPAQPDRSPPAAASANGSQPEPSKDATAARIVATKMALDGASREEIAKHLERSYEIEGVDALLDDVLARAAK